VFPTYSVVAHNIDLFSSLVTTKGLPKFNPMMLLHAEQKTQVIKPINPGAKLISEATMVDVADKGKAASLSIMIKMYEILDGGKKELVTANTYTLFIRGLGGFGYKGTSKETIPDAPKRTPDKIHKEKTDPSQALLYRLSGDTNPLHVDSDMAAMGGFDKPILHGLCTYGFAAKAIVQLFCGNDQTQFKSIYARFTSHVFPGETMVFEFWLDGPTKIILQAKTEERGLVVLKGVAEITPNAKL